MLDWTTPECRRLHRLFSPHARLYTEMVTTGAIIYGDKMRHLRHFVDEPCALQLGGGKPEELAKATAMAQAFAYQEINLNVGCPSDRVQNNQIGACLMADAPLVAKCLSAMQRESDVPVTVKHRLGIDEQDERQIFDFVDCLLQGSSCRVFIVHARKAWLQGLSPKANRDVPPLNYELVYELKQRFPEATIVINGGIETIEACEKHLHYVDGVMLGRAAYKNPAILLSAESLFNTKSLTEEQLIPVLTQEISQALERGERLSDYVRHLLGMFAGQKGAKQFRRILSEEARLPEAGIEIWQKAVARVIL
ncbi:Probable tRNA-dihydrouridine synthase [Suttonella ornithocola]|uniref:tRNA-dihydrouridine synthase n=2 Tax=Suttonella ornithocola TaxID=279832 RepID=A0A380MUA6_9GAMM|nr:Probable tRNA-dihydrouridine synthase [Suttonella ornithocola]